MSNIVMQKQTIHNGCMSACLAMICNADVNVVTREFHEDFMHFVESGETYARKHGVKLAEPFPGKFRDHIVAGMVYILNVPSLNSPGMMHAVVLDTRDPEDTKLYDPAQGQIYLSPHQYEGEPGTTQVISWTVKYIVEDAPWLKSN